MFKDKFTSECPTGMMAKIDCDQAVGGIGHVLLSVLLQLTIIMA